MRVLASRIRRLGPKLRREDNHVLIELRIKSCARLPNQSQWHFKAGVSLTSNGAGVLQASYTELKQADLV